MSRPIIRLKGPLTAQFLVWPALSLPSLPDPIRSPSPTSLAVAPPPLHPPSPSPPPLHRCWPTPPPHRPPPASPARSPPDVASPTSPSAARVCSLAGKVALITGGASGIGAATAAEFVRNGARVIIADVQDDLGRAVAAELGHDAACYTRCNVADEAQIAAAVDLAVARHGKLDVMFNNAGIAGDVMPTPLAAIDLADFDRVVMAVNARAVVAGVKHAARVMAPRGSIICTASVARAVGGVAMAPYSVSKAAVLGLVRAAAGELARSGVRVNAISPSYIPTPATISAMAKWFTGMSIEERRRIVERDMNWMDGNGPVLEAEDVARAALYLASDEAMYVNGHNLVVDGGCTVSKAPKMPKPGH